MKITIKEEYKNSVITKNLPKLGMFSLNLNKIEESEYAFYASLGFHDAFLFDNEEIEREEGVVLPRNRKDIKNNND